MAITTTLPIAIPPTPSPPPSDDTTNTNNSVPPTPISPSSSSQQQQQQQQKRKPSRRANTAERRATHNAVERQRRETLNSRFLDLAALLPNLSQIRRPSKSSIVNSSIAHIHASRRHRLLAARELRLLKLEADALRRELNEWRERSAIARIEEPVRGEGFGVVLSAELEVIVGQDMEEEEDDELLGAQEGLHASAAGGMWGEEEGEYGMEQGEEIQHDARMLAMLKAPANQGAGGMLPHILPRPGATNVPAFEGIYEHQQQQQQPQQIHLIQHQQQQYVQQRHHDQDKMWGLYPSNANANASANSNGAQYNTNTNGNNNYLAAHQHQQHQHQQMLLQQQQQQQQQQRMFTPPHTAHGLPSPTTSTGLSTSNGGTPPPLPLPLPQSMAMSIPLTRERSASVHSSSSVHSLHGHHGHHHNPNRASHSPSYEIGFAPGVGVGVDYMGVNVGVDPYGVGVGMPRMMDMPLTSPVVGGGGGGVAMMML